MSEEHVTVRFTSSLRTSEKTDELDAALAASQGQLSNVEKKKKVNIPAGTNLRTGKAYGPKNYSYCDIADVLSEVRKILSKNGIAFIQGTDIRGDMLVLITRLSCKGQWIESDYPVCPISLDLQERGIAMTYARRYALCALVGIAGEDDTDGEDAADPKAPGRASPKTLPPPPPPPPPKEADPAAGEKRFDAKAHLSELEGLLNKAKNLERIKKIWTHHESAVSDQKTWEPFEDRALECLTSNEQRLEGAAMQRGYDAQRDGAGRAAPPGEFDPSAWLNGWDSAAREAKK